MAVEYQIFDNHSLRWGCVFSNEHGFSVESILQGICLETKRFVSNSVNVILTLQACGVSAGSKYQALEKYFHEQICYMFRISKCREVWDLGLCTFWVLAKREPLRNAAKFWFFLQAKHVFWKSPLRSCSFFESTQKMHGTKSWFQSFLLFGI